jgi:hypothetical protein
MALNAAAKKWVKALRSGKYKQGKNYLRTGDRFCCLGVACELAVKAGIIPPASEPTIQAAVKGVLAYEDQKFGLPKSVQTWLGLQDCLGRFADTTLGHLNDKGKRFTTIARIIESEPDGLFV